MLEATLEQEKGTAPKTSAESFYEEVVAMEADAASP